MIAINVLNKKVEKLVAKHIVSVNPTIKIDGTCCLIRNGQLFKRYDRKLNTRGSIKNKSFQKQLQSSEDKENILKFSITEDYKEGPEGWIPCDSDKHLFESEQATSSSQHLVGWVPVNFSDNADKWHSTAVAKSKKDGEMYCLLLMPYYDEITKQAEFRVEMKKLKDLDNQTLELVGCKINGNVYNFPKQEKQHFLVPHGMASFAWDSERNNFLQNLKGLNLDNLKTWFEDADNLMSKSEGVVFHIIYKDSPSDENNRTMLIKIHRHHLNLKWPLKTDQQVQYQFKQEWLDVVTQLKADFDFVA